MKFWSFHSRKCVWKYLRMAAILSRGRWVKVPMAWFSISLTFWSACGLVSTCSFHPWWRHQMETFSALLAICAGNSPVTGEIQWRGALVFPLICVWINGWVNNREAGDLRHHRAHYDVIVMSPLGWQLYEWDRRFHDFSVVLWPAF